MRPKWLHRQRFVAWPNEGFYHDLERCPWIWHCDQLEIDLHVIDTHYVWKPTQASKGDRQISTDEMFFHQLAQTARLLGEHGMNEAAKLLR